jgi:hypothetical protein
MTPNLNEATSLVNSIPLVKESIPVLMKLANGSNPNIPSYMALGRLQQIKAMVEHSQQPQMPQGTVKQNLERSVANMGMMNGRQQQMQQNMMQQGITAPGPAPEGVPQPQPMPQPEQQPQEVMAAHGGILHTQTDPQMFNFAPGGIVAFSGEDKDQEVKDKEKKSKTLIPNPPSPGEALSSIWEAIKSGAISAGEAIKSGAIGVADAVSAQNEKIRDEAEKRRALERMNLPLIDQNTGMPPAVNKITGDSGFKPYVSPADRALGLDGRVQMDSSTDPRSTMMGQPKPAGVTGTPPPPPSPAAAPRPRPVVAPAAPAAPAAVPGAAATTEQGLGSLNSVDRVKQLLGQLTPSNEYIKGIGTRYDAAKLEDFDQQKAIADKLALNESLGIGTYGKNRREQMAQRAKEFEGNRMSKLDQLISLGTAFSRPGARAGDVGQRSVELNEAERDARERFQTAQDALMNTVELADEAIRTGNATSIVAAKEAHKKALQEYKMAGVEVAKTQAQAEGLRQQTGTQAATSVFGDETRLQAERERTASAEKVAAANNVNAQKVAEIYAAASRAGANRPSEQERFANDYFAVVKSQGQAAADAWLAQQEKVRGAYNSGRFQDKEPDRDIKIKALIDKRTEILTGRLDREKDPVKQAALKKQISDIAKQVREELGRESSDAPPPGKVRQTSP